MSAWRGHILCLDKGSEPRRAWPHKEPGNAVMWWRLATISQQHMRGFRDLFRQKPSSLFIMLGRSSISITSLTMRSMYLGLVEKMAVWCSWLRWPYLILCSATANLSRYVAGAPSTWFQSYIIQIFQPADWLFSLPPAFVLVSCSAYLTLKMEVICSSKALNDFQQTTRPYIPEYSTRHSKAVLV
jgi:hypothetical protein